MAEELGWGGEELSVSLLGSRLEHSAVVTSCERVATPSCERGNDTSTRDGLV